MFKYDSSGNKVPMSMQSAPLGNTHENYGSEINKKNRWWVYLLIAVVALLIIWIVVRMIRKKSVKVAFF